MAETTARPRPRAPKRCDLKVFTVEFTSNFEGGIPLGWTPFAVHALPGAGDARALVYAYKQGDANA